MRENFRMIDGGSSESTSTGTNDVGVPNVSARSPRIGAMIDPIARSKVGNRAGFAGGGSGTVWAVIAALITKRREGPRLVLR
jgi:hypothetical protein